MSSSSNSPKEISSIRTSLSPAVESLCTVPRGMNTFSPTLGLEYFFAELYLGSLVQYDPELVATVVVLARERAAGSDGDDLDRTGQVVRVLLEPAPGLVYLYRRRAVIHA